MQQLENDENKFKMSRSAEEEREKTYKWLRRAR